MHIHQEVRMPALHGSAPKNLAMAVRRPKGPTNVPQAPKKFKALKDAMAYYKERDKENEENKNEK